ncbi:MAG: dipeptidase PepE [Streptosporangiales bacterium]|nr:dipeptidase PepE [Streptosporangiales bacterium]
MELLLLSNSRAPGSPPFAHVQDELADFVGERRVLFVPYALAEHDEYTASVATALRPYGIQVTGVHTTASPADAVRAAEVVFVGGGNSFRLLKTLQALDLVAAIRAAVGAGTRYIGSSAGTNMACPSLRTTNDMPIVQPASFEALDLVPFQINPHYVDPDPVSTHMGETREERLLQFLEENDVAVLGLREGSYLRVAGDRATLGGVRPARVFERGAEPREVMPGTDLSDWLTRRPAFDAVGR